MAAESTESKGRKIVVAVDEGAESDQALSWCLKNMAAAGDTIVLLHAQPPRAVYSAMDGTGYLFSSDIIQTMEKYSKEVAEAVIQRAERTCAGLENVKVESRVEKGDPRDVICEAVESVGADVLVLGSHGYGLIKRTFLGSVSNHCAQNVKCPVLIVKNPKPLEQ
ncbi:universal stress protein A-like protein [Wolffia australiana]